MTITQNNVRIPREKKEKKRENNNNNNNNNNANHMTKLEEL